jgi:thiamine transport system permease protein
VAKSLAQIIRRERPDATRLAAGLLVMAVICVLVVAGIGATFVSGVASANTEGLSAVLPAALFTVKQAALSTLLSIGFAIPVAVALEGLPDFTGRRFLLALFAVPLALPAIAVVLGLMQIYGRNGLIADGLAGLGLDLRPDLYGLSGILIAHVFFNMPLAVRLMSKAIEEIPQEQWKLAESLRFGAGARVRHLLWPVIRQSLPGAAGLVFLLCAGSYTIILVLGGGPSTTTLQVAIQQSLSFEFDPAKASLLTLAQLALTGFVLALLPRGGKNLFQTGGTMRRRWHKTGAAEYSVSAAAIGIAALYVTAPLLAIMVAGVNADHARILASPLFAKALTTSLAIAFCSALIATGCAYSLASSGYVLDSHGKTRLAGAVGKLATSLLGIPALILGVGWFVLLAMAGQPFALAPLLIILANALMALPFALQMMIPAINRHYADDDRLCASLGLGGLQRFRLIDWPVLRPALTGAFMIAAALSLGDLGVVTLYGSDRVLTLPSLIYQNLGSYRSTDADGLVLYLTLLTGALTLIGTRRQTHVRR